MNRTLRYVVASLIATAAAYGLSSRLERSLGHVVSTKISPEKCFRLVEYRPFWILPSLFHSYEHDGMKTFLRPWGQPVFYRLYDNRTNNFLGETPMLDAHLDETFVEWDIHPIDAPRRISVGYNRLIETHDCSSLQIRAAGRSAP